MPTGTAIPKPLQGSLKALQDVASEYNAIAQARGAEIRAIEKALFRYGISMLDHACNTPFLVKEEPGTDPGHKIEWAYRLKLAGIGFRVESRRRVIEVPSGKVCDTCMDESVLLSDAKREIRIAAMKQMPAFLDECRQVMAEKVAQAKADEA